MAGISGYAVAGGLELALLCDLRVVEETAVMGLYGRRFGRCHDKVVNNKYLETLLSYK